MARPWLAVWAVFAAGVVCGAYIGKVPPALPVIRDELGLNLVEAGLVATMLNLTGCTVGMFVGVLCDRYGYKPLALGGLAGMAVAGLIGAAAGSYAALLVARFLEGVGFILFTVAATALIAAAIEEPRARAKAFALWSTYMPTGGSLALLGAPPLIAAIGWRGLWLACALGAAGALLLVQRHAIAPRRHAPLASLRLIRESMTRPGSVALALLFAFYVAQWTSVMIWLPTFLVDERGASTAAAALAAAGMVLINIPGNLTGGWLLAHGVPRGPLIIAASAIAALTDAAMLLPLPDALRFAAVYVFSFCSGAIPGTIFSGVPLHAKTPQHLGTTNGMVMQSSQAGQFVGPIVLAWLATRFGGWGATLGAMLAFAAACALCGYVILRIERNLHRVTSNPA